MQTLRNENEYITSGVHKFSKICRNHLKILGAIWLTYSKLHFGNLKLLGAVVRNVFAQAIWRLGFLNPGIMLIPIRNMRWNKVQWASGFRFWQRQVGNLMSPGMLRSIALKMCTEISNKFDCRHQYVTVHVYRYASNRLHGIVYQNTTIFVRVEAYFKRIIYLVKCLLATEDKYMRLIAGEPEQQCKESLTQSYCYTCSHKNQHARIKMIYFSKSWGNLFSQMKVRGPIKSFTGKGNGVISYKIN